MYYRATTILRKVNSLKLNVHYSSRTKGEPKKIGAAGYLFLVSLKCVLGLSTHLFLEVAPATTFCLGVWQYNRRQWKINLIEELQEKVRHADPVLLK